MTAARTKRGIAHQRLGQQVEQFIAIEGIHSPTIRLERMATGTVCGVARASAHRREDVLGARRVAQSRRKASARRFPLAVP